MKQEKATPENTPVLETPRLLLRRFRKEDAKAALSIFGDAEVNTFLPWFPVKTEQEALDFLEERYFSLYRKPGGYGYAICLKDEDVPVGYLGVSPREPFDFGYGLKRQLWGNGIITEAGRAVIARVKADGLPYLTATHDRNNPRSSAVMRRLGMTYRYSYLEQWQPKNIPVVFRMYQMNFTVDPAWSYPGYWEKYPEHLTEPGL